MSGDEDFGTAFETLFGKDERTTEEREADRLRGIKERHEREQQAFERERDRRADYIAMDNRIRRIIGEEIGKLYILGLAFAAMYGLGNKYGWWAGAAVVVAYVAWHWWEERKLKDTSKYKIEEVDELAEDTVQHERLVELEEAGKPWLHVGNVYVEWTNVFDAPYWEQVNKRVRTYAVTPYQKRIADNAAARSRSLPFREAMNAKLQANPKFKEGDFDLPYWARIRDDEKGKHK